MIAAPDPLALLPTSDRMLRDWAAMAELSADDAAGQEQSDRLHLASALVKVARLATTPPEALPASTLYRGEPIAERVRRLLDGPVAAHPAPPSRWKRGAAITLAFAAAPLFLAALHGALETLLGLGLP